MNSTSSGKNGPVPVHGVERLRSCAGEVHHARRHDAQPGGFESSVDLPDGVLRHRIRLDDREGSFHRHEDCSLADRACRVGSCEFGGDWIRRCSGTGELALGVDPWTLIVPVRGSGGMGVLAEIEPAFHRKRRRRRSEGIRKAEEELPGSRGRFANAAWIVGRCRHVAGGGVSRRQTPKLSPQPHRFFTLGLS